MCLNLSWNGKQVQLDHLDGLKLCVVQDAKCSVLLLKSQNDMEAVETIEIKALLKMISAQHSSNNGKN